MEILQIFKSILKADIQRIYSRFSTIPILSTEKKQNIKDYDIFQFLR